MSMLDALDDRPALLPHALVERHEHVPAPSRGDMQDVARLRIRHHGHVPVPAAERGLVHRKAPNRFRLAARKSTRHRALHDSVHGVPAQPHPLGDRLYARHLQPPDHLRLVQPVPPGHVCDSLSVSSWDRCRRRVLRGLTTQSPSSPAIPKGDPRLSSRSAAVPVAWVPNQAFVRGVVERSPVVTAARPLLPARATPVPLLRTPPPHPMIHLQVLTTNHDR